MADPVSMVVDHVTLDISADTLACSKRTVEVDGRDHGVRESPLPNGRPVRAKSRCQRSCLFKRPRHPDCGGPAARAPSRLRPKISPVDLDACGESAFLHARKGIIFGSWPFETRSSTFKYPHN